MSSPENFREYLCHVYASVCCQKSSCGEFCRTSTFFALIAARMCLPNIKLRSKNDYIPLNENNCLLVNKMNNLFKVILYYERKIHCVPATPPQLWINTRQRNRIFQSITPEVLLWRELSLFKHHWQHYPQFLHLSYCLEKVSLDIT